MLDESGMEGVLRAASMRSMHSSLHLPRAASMLSMHPSLHLPRLPLADRPGHSAELPAYLGEPGGRRRSIEDVRANIITRLGSTTGRGGNGLASLR